MRQSSNPAFASFRDGSRGGSTNFGAGFGTRTTGAGQFGPVDETQFGRRDTGPVIAATEEPMTMDNVISTTSATLATALAVGAAIIYFGVASTPLLIGSAIGGLVLAMIIIFKQSTNPLLVLGYAALEGVVLGTITAVYERFYNGIAVLAVLATVGVFFGMLVVHKLQVIKVTSTFVKGISAAVFGLVILMFGSMALSFFGINTGLRSGGMLGIGFSVVCIVVAALSFLVDFHMIEQAVAQRAPKRAAWYFGFSLMVTLVWLYLEILRLLSYVMRRD